MTVTITPDDKDWTWVISRPCPECGLDMANLPRDEFAARLRATAAAWRDQLSVAPNPRRRPSRAVWSMLEYGCHVRDVLLLTDYRLQLMLTTDEARYPNWDQDAAAISGRYNEQDPADVAEAIYAVADVVATRLDGLSAIQWRRTGSRGDGARFTVESFARYNIHDEIHHLYDISGVRQGGGAAESPAG
jgi:DinB superfamily